MGETRSQKAMEISHVPLSEMSISGQETERPIKLEHQSTIGGIVFDASGRRLAVSHYGGVTIWERPKRRWKSSVLAWKGFHGAVSFSPDGKYVVTAMQENALHGWRLRDKGHLAMSGYPAKVKSFAWIGETLSDNFRRRLSVVCWPFDGKFGPMGGLRCVSLKTPNFLPMCKVCRARMRLRRIQRRFRASCWHQ